MNSSRNSFEMMCFSRFIILQSVVTRYLFVQKVVNCCDKRNTNNFHGIPILAHVKGSMGDYYIVLELDNKGKIWLKIGQPGKEKSIDNIINTKIAEHSARSLSHNAQGRTSQNETAISLSSIQKELANVKEKYEQRAWHGSPYNFNTFDLGAIGKGEGNQAHG